MAWFGAGEPRDGARTGPRASGLRLAPFVLTVFFGIVFAAIADLAWLTAVKTTAPWYTSTVSAQTYGSTLTGAAVGALVLISIATSRLARLRSSRSAPTPAPRPLPLRSAVPAIELGARSPVGPSIALDRFDEVLADLEKFTEDAARSARDARSASSVQVELVRPGTVSTDAEAEAATTSMEQPYWSQRAMIWQTVAGPLAMFVVFVAIGGAMLPGSGAFALKAYQMNTGLILFLSYGWAFLVAWAVAVVLVLNATSRDRPRRPAEDLASSRSWPLSGGLGVDADSVGKANHAASFRPGRP